MKVVEKLLNRYEEVVFSELSSIAKSNSLKLFSKVRLSDVLEKTETWLSEAEFVFYTRSHFDFIITDNDTKPFLAVEFDGPSHQDSRQRDAIKNSLCSRATLPLVRIGSNHVSRTFRGMTALRWIVEVGQLQNAFDEAQAIGQIPFDEDFDPTFLMTMERGSKFPYWLSAEATVRIHKFLKARGQPKGWF